MNGEDIEGVIEDEKEKRILKTFGFVPGGPSSFVPREKYEKKMIDLRSYSYRLIGHIYACEENYAQAVSALQSAIELSPNYEDAYYDYAQYCALVGKKDECLTSLQKAIVAKPFYFYLAKKERNFDPLRYEVQDLLTKLSKEVFERVKRVISKVESELEEATKASPRVSNTLKEEKLAKKLFDLWCNYWSYPPTRKDREIAAKKIAEEKYMYDKFLKWQKWMPAEVSIYIYLRTGKPKDGIIVICIKNYN